MKSINIADRQVGPRHPCFIIAEAGVNHNGDIALAKRLIEVAAQAGADAVKFQTFKAERVITPTAPKADYQKVTTDQAESQFKMLQKLELQREDYHILQGFANEQHILCFSTPYSSIDAQFLFELGVPAYKIASIDIVNIPLLKTVASWHKPIILSTGMATLGEIEQGIQTIRDMGNENIVLLQCTTNYPIQDSEVHLRVMKTLKQAFAVQVGFSDHTVGWEIPLAAVALGATVIEKHFTLDRTLPGPDHVASLEPQEFAMMVQGIRRVEKALGQTHKQIQPVELENRKAMRRSLVAAKEIPSDTLITEDMLILKRPGTGLGIEFLSLLVGKKTRKIIDADTIFTLDMVE